ncbi:DNA-directed RNA polymerase subunit RPC12/RpoP [Nocardiopsis mwathae]|uniref:DNA-directed RNA polymerase subunit RPC12/RpoP n=1 Tax=Nocardiopsis mwathae TaxID=1472723 RepID=A0A7W9YME5_9ACTN|nr:hypothetical protein [Nocardiopsis mwathae]MBB6174819.1 DNA-directed RNA polymerase subunit RPC12/RpoP [Nocardiopsis mwathae]
MTDNTAVPPASSPYSAPCQGCGARLEFAPGTRHLQCPYCGGQQAIAAPRRKVREHSYDELMAKQRRPAAELAPQRFLCQGCGAHTQGDVLARGCQFCAAPLVADTSQDLQVEPEAVLPFAVDRDGARDALRSWVKTRWFAPNRLKKVSEAETMRSTYLPHWTFDTRTVSDYKGKRGEYYYVTETYTVTVDGKQEERTRKVRKTRWYPAKGTVRRDFDDVLVPATTQVDNARLDALEPWPLKKQAVAYRPEYLAGHQALRYDVEPEDGLTEAKARMAPVIEKDCCNDIGGDEQQVTSVDTTYSDITYKLMLLPVWMGCYLYKGKNWQVLINGCSGEVQGERPYSGTKILFALLVAAAVIALIWWMAQGDGTPPPQ